jgi:hypothetical protein
MTSAQLVKDWAAIIQLVDEGKMKSKQTPINDDKSSSNQKSKIKKVAMNI